MTLDLLAPLAVYSFGPDEARLVAYGVLPLGALLLGVLAVASTAKGRW